MTNAVHRALVTPAGMRLSFPNVARGRLIRGTACKLSTAAICDGDSAGFQHNPSMLQSQVHAHQYVVVLRPVPHDVELDAQFAANSSDGRQQLAALAICKGVLAGGGM